MSNISVEFRTYLESEPHGMLQVRHGGRGGGAAPTTMQQCGEHRGHLRAAICAVKAGAADQRRYCIVCVCVYYSIFHKRCDKIALSALYPKVCIAPPTFQTLKVGQTFIKLHRMPYKVEGRRLKVFKVDPASPDAYRACSGFQWRSQAKKDIRAFYLIRR